MSAALVSMARSPEELKTDPSYGTIMPYAEKDDQPVYPYGLCISLCDEELEKLDLDADCKAGDEIIFVARATVADVGQRMTTGGPKSRLELQIVALRIIDATPDGDNDADDNLPADDQRVAKRYGGVKKE